jgi:hypothetical protein
MWTLLPLRLLGGEDAWGGIAKDYRTFINTAF